MKKKSITNLILNIMIKKIDIVQNVFVMKKIVIFEMEVKIYCHLFSRFLFLIFPVFILNKIKALCNRCLNDQEWRFSAAFLVIHLLNLFFLFD